MLHLELSVLERDMLKREELDNADIFNFHLWCEDAEFDLYIDKLSKQLCKKSPQLSELKNSTIHKHLKVVILNLWCVWLKDKKKYLVISRRKNSYAKSTLPARYNQIGISFKINIVIDALISNNSIEFHNGINYAEYKRRSRIRAKLKLINQIVKNNKISQSLIQMARNAPCIILRDKDIDDDKKVNVEYRDTKRTNEMRDGLIEYNNLIRRTHVDIPTFPTSGVKKSNGDVIKINFESDVSKFTHRVFSNNSWKDGGRFYGSWWLQLPSEWRKHIRINNKPTTEIDFSCLHIIFLYAKVKINYWKDIGRDAYDLTSLGYEMDDKLRDFLKIVLLTSINCEKGKNKDIEKARASVQHHMNKNKTEYMWVKERGIDIKQLIMDFAEYHKPIKKYFYSGAGLSLQYIDALIAEMVLNHFTNLKIPVLCVHDSFIIQSKYGYGDGDKSLEWMMGCIFQEVLKSEIKNYALSKMKFDEMLNMDEINKLVSKNKEIPQEYWNRVDAHKKRMYVINLYNQDEVRY